MSKQTYLPRRQGRRGLMFVIIVLAVLVTGSTTAFALISIHRRKDHPRQVDAGFHLRLGHWGDNESPGYCGSPTTS